MCRSCFSLSGSHQHGPPLLGRVRTPPRSPTSTLLCSPPTPSSPSAAAPVVPRKRPTSARRACSSPPHRCPAKPDTTPETFLPRLPTRRLRPEERQGPPRCLGHPLSRVPQSSTPPGAMRPSPAHGALAVAFRSSETLGTRNAFDFGALLPTAHSLACLRFAQAVTVSGARLATGRAGSPLAGRGSHPLDDEQGFMVSSHTPILLDQPCLVAPKAGIHGAATEHGCSRLRRDGAGTARTNFSNSPPTLIDACRGQACPRPTPPRPAAPGSSASR